MNIFQRAARWIQGLFPKIDIEHALDVKIATSPAMLAAQELWRKLYIGEAPWNSEDVPSLFLAAGLCVEFARSVTVELNSEITGSPRAEYLQEQYIRVLDDLRKTTEKACAGGTVIIRPFVRGELIHTRTIENNGYWPIRYNELGDLVEVVFADIIHRDEKYYTLLEHCDWKDNTYSIEYHAYKSDDKEHLGMEISRTEVEEWANLLDISFDEVEQPWFSVFKMPQLNHVEQNAPEGVSVFSKAVDLIRKADELASQTEWEFKGGELAVFAPADMWKDIGKKDALNPRNGQVKLEIPDGKERLYVNTGIDSTSLKTPETFNPEFRDDSLHRGLDRIKRQIEFNCGMSYGIISDPQTVQRTATEIEASLQRFWSSVSDVQKSLEESLRRLIEIMDDMSTRYLLAPQGNYDVSFDWDDSIIVNQAEQQTEVKAEIGTLIGLLGAQVIQPNEIRAVAKNNLKYFSMVTEDDIIEASKEVPGAFEEGAGM